MNFDGTGTDAIRDAYNVDSITDNGVGDYTVNFTNPMQMLINAVTVTGSLMQQPQTGVFGECKTAQYASQCHLICSLYKDDFV